MEDKQKSLSAKDICAIITACASGGVKTFTYGALTLEFGPNQESIPGPIITTTQWPPRSLEDLGLRDVQVTESPRPEDSYGSDPDLYITDPVAWEKSQLEEING